MKSPRSARATAGRTFWRNPENIQRRVFRNLFLPIFALPFTRVLNTTKMSHPLLQEFEKQNQEIRSRYPDFKAGDTVNVAVKIREGNKERIQNFQGTVIQRRNSGSNGETFTVRKVSGGVGVERIFPILSPNIDSVTIIRQGKVRRARIFYIRGKQGKKARIKEKMS